MVSAENIFLEKLLASKNIKGAARKVTDKWEY